MMKIVLSLVLLLMNPVMYAQKSAQEYYELAQQKSIQGKLKQAYKYYYKAGELDHNYLYYVKAAEAYFLSHNNSKRENIKQTLSLYNQSMKLKNWNSEGLLSRASYFNYIAQYKNALADLDSLLARDPVNSSGYMLKAEIYMMKKDTLNAFSVYNQAIGNISDAKDQARLYNHKGTRCYMNGYWLQSIAAYQQEIKLNGSEKFSSNCFLSSAYDYVGDKDKACYYFKFCDIKKYPMPTNKDELINNCH